MSIRTSTGKRMLHAAGGRAVVTRKPARHRVGEYADADRAYSRPPLKPDALRVLGALADAPLKPREIAERLGVAPSKVNGALSGPLSLRGLAMRSGGGWVRAEDGIPVATGGEA